VKTSTLVAALLLAMIPCGALATPDERGPYTVMTWDRGNVTLDGTSIHVHAFFPRELPGRFRWWASSTVRPALRTT